MFSSGLGWLFHTDPSQLVTGLESKEVVAGGREEVARCSVGVDSSRGGFWCGKSLRLQTRVLFLE